MKQAETKALTIEDFKAADRAEEQALAAKEEKLAAIRRELEDLDRDVDEAFQAGDRDRYKKLNTLRADVETELRFMEAEPVEIPEKPGKEDAAEVLRVYTENFNAAFRAKQKRFDEALKAALQVLDELAEDRNAALGAVNYLSYKAGIPQAEAHYRLACVEFAPVLKFYRARDLIGDRSASFYNEVFCADHYIKDREKEMAETVRLSSIARQMLESAPVGSVQILMPAK